MRQIMCVHLSQWPIDRWRRAQRAAARRELASDGPGQGEKEKKAKASGSAAEGPVVLFETVASRQLVAACSQEAKRRGIRMGMTLAEARALCPGLAHGPYEPEKDHRSLEALGRWMMRFSPIVSCGTGQAGADLLPAVFLDVGGCERVFGGLHSLMEQVVEAMRRMRLHARVAIAPTVGAAWAIASAGAENGTLVPPGKVGEALAPLPAGALRIEREIVEALDHLGIETIGQLMRLPRSALPARFGSSLLLRLDQAMGRVAEPLAALVHETPIEARMDFEGVVSSLEAMWLVFKELIRRVVGELARRGRGARKIELVLFREGAAPITRTLALSRASRDARHLFNLARCAAEGEPWNEPATRRTPGRPRRRAPATEDGADFTRVSDGFTAIALRVPVFQRMGDVQTMLLEREEHEAQAELDHLVERLVLRLGEQAVARVRLTESYMPERAWVWEAGEKADWKLVTYCGKENSASFLEDPSSGCARENSLPPRPLRLFSRPAEIGVMVCPSHDQDGRPISMRRDRQARRLVHAIGPERIAGAWWEGRNKTRDYFAVEDETGRRSWIFRVLETGKWYVHGEFE